MASVVPLEDRQHENMLKDKPPASYLDEEVKAHASTFSSVHVANQPRFDSFLRRLSAETLRVLCAVHVWCPRNPEVDLSMQKEVFGRLL